MTYLIEIDRDSCSAHGECEAIAPELFRVDDVAEVIGSGHDELALEAARLCPAVAITITDADSGRQVFP
jgi:ferredoxin